MPLVDFSSRVISVSGSGAYISPVQIETDYMIALYLSLFNCVTYSLAMPTVISVSG